MFQNAASLFKINKQYFKQKIFSDKNDYKNDFC